MTAEQSLIRLYRQAAQRLRVQLAQDLASQNIGSAVWRRRQLQAVRAQLAALGQRTRTTPIELVAAGYDRGAGLVDVVAGQTTAADVIAGRVSYAFAGAHARAPRILADNIANRLDGARLVVGRRVEDVYRRAALEQIGESVAAGATRRETSRAIAERLTREGVTGFVDRRGANWQLDTYAETVARTTTREAMSAGTRERMVQTGQDLVTISAHGADDELCGPREGVTYSISGRTPGYPVMTDDDWPPFHPRCLHVATPGAENLDALLDSLGVLAPAGSP